MTPPFPVITRNGFKYFLHPSGRTSAAIHVNGAMLYAEDFPVSEVVVVDDRPQEPGDFEFIRALNSQRRQ
jgi:hypothetical protein